MKIFVEPFSCPICMSSLGYFAFLHIGSRNHLHLSIQIPKGFHINPFSRRHSCKNGRRHSKRFLMSWVFVIPHTTCAHPSFGMTLIQDIRDFFDWRHSSLLAPVCIRVKMNMWQWNLVSCNSRHYSWSSEYGSMLFSPQAVWWCADLSQFCEGILVSFKS